MPPLYGWTNKNQASLANLNLPGPDLNGFSGNRRPHGVHKSSWPSVPLADQVQASSMDIQPSMIPPRQPYPLCSEPYLDDRHCPRAVSSQFVGAAWPTSYPPGQKDFHLNIGDMPWPKQDKVFHEHPLSLYVQKYMGHSEDYAAHSGSPTNIEPRPTAFNPHDLSYGDWPHLDNSHRVQEMCPPYHDEYKDRPGISRSTHQTQEMMTLTCTQDFGCVPGKSPLLLQAWLQKLENADPNAPAGNSPAHQAVDLHGILDLSPMESSIDRSPLQPQSSGHLGSSQVFPTNSRGSSPENPGFSWDEDLVTPVAPHPSKRPPTFGTFGKASLRFCQL